MDFYGRSLRPSVVKGINYTGKVQTVSMVNFKLFLNVKLSMDICDHHPSIMHIIHESCMVSMNNAIHYSWTNL